MLRRSILQVQYARQQRRRGGIARDVRRAFLLFNCHHAMPFPVDVDHAAIRRCAARMRAISAYEPNRVTVPRAVRYMTRTG